MRQAQVYPIFSKPIYINHIEQDISFVHPILEKIKFTNAHVKNSDKFLSVSVNHDILQEENFKKIKEIILSHFSDYMTNFCSYNNKFSLTTSWLNKTNFGQHGQYHNHNNCMFSGVIYLKTPKDGAQLSFQNFENKSFVLKPKEYNILNNSEFIVTASQGTIVMFPAEVFHRVCYNSTSEERISLAFNFTPVGELGNNYEEIIVKYKGE